MPRSADLTLAALYENALRDIAEILAGASGPEAMAALEIAADALTHALDEMEAGTC
ncbi:hypothetical protein [Methylobacterium soli]|uniref:hypothetical protein n=1 Tax=Methylobacterium soli TaxID=553447 RepID=UPI001786B663|nr:hypothetical protein [Methylobacterium soli]GJE43493.1 hypothetical protein AEGHOMDF_2672 [Methylobacterium soli]